MELSSGTDFAKEFPSGISGHLMDHSAMRYQVPKGNSILEWMRWNGAYLYAYGCSLAGIICAIISPLSDMFVVFSSSLSIGIKEITYSHMYQKSSALDFLESFS